MVTVTIVTSNMHNFSFCLSLSVIELPELHSLPNQGVSHQNKHTVLQFLCPLSIFDSMNLL